MNWQFIDYQGKVAVTLGWSPETEKPVEHRDIWHSPNAEWDEWYYSRFTQVRLVENNFYMCFNKNTYQEEPMHTPNWIHVHENRSIKPPGRGGKNWRWEWSWGRWIKRWF